MITIGKKAVAVTTTTVAIAGGGTAFASRTSTGSGHSSVKLADGGTDHDGCTGTSVTIDPVTR